MPLRPQSSKDGRHTAPRSTTGRTTGSQRVFSHEKLSNPHVGPSRAMRLRIGFRLHLLLFLLLAFAGGASAQKAITTAQQAHSLSAEEARRSHPVRLRAVITYFDPLIDTRHAALFVQDASGGVFVALPSDSTDVAEGLKLGMLVEVTGVSAPGDFASIVSASNIRVLSPTHPLNQAKKADLAELRAGLEDCKRVEVDGVVQAVSYSKNNITLEIAMADGIIGATTRRLPSSKYNELVDSKIRLRGVAAPIFNHDFQIAGARLFFENESQIDIERPGPENPFSLPLRSISSLSRYEMGEGLRHLAHVRGAVTLLWPGRLICVQDPSGAICAQSEGSNPLQIGDDADVVGFVALGGAYRPALTHALFQHSGTASSITATHISAGTALRGEYDAKLVQMEGRIIGEDFTGGQTNLLLSKGKVVFAVHLPPGDPGGRSNALPTGSLVRVTGICSVEVDRHETLLGEGFEIAKSFQILARSPGDILVLQKPSVWTASRILLLLVLALTLTALVLAWVYVLRRRVEQQTRMIRESEERFRHLAQHDALTHLPTRRVLRERLQGALDAARAVPSRLALLMVDLDDFKSINDTLGHHAGDEALRTTARRLVSAVRPVDTVARMGGDEFLILLNGLDYDKQPEDVASRIVNSFAETLTIGQTDVSLSASIGVFTDLDPGTDLDVLLKKVDAAMYSAKASGRNCFKSFSTDMESASHRTFQIRSHLPRALANAEFHLHYQPLVDLKTGCIMGFEALLRWTNPELGSVPPDEFIPIAEDSQLIVGIGEWVLEEAVREIAALQQKCGWDFLVSVNLSPRQFLHEGLTRAVRKSLAEHNFKPCNLQLEITERTLVSHVPDVQRVLDSLRELGVQLAIDDFGVGFSSLSYIAHLPVDWIKVDRRLVADCLVNPRSSAVLRAIIAMAQSIGVRVVAEGIEIAEVYDLVKREAFDVGQGYWISRPVPQAALESLVYLHNEQSLSQY